MPRDASRKPLKADPTYDPRWCNRNALQEPGALDMMTSAQGAIERACQLFLGVSGR